MTLAGKLDWLIWALIFGGLVIISVGLFAERSSASIGWSLVIAGGGAAGAGVVLVWVRSRVPD